MKHAYFLHTGYGKTKLMLDLIMSKPLKPRVLLISTKSIVEGSWQAEIDKWYPNQISYAYITGKVPVKERLKIAESNPDILALNTNMIDWYIKNTVDVKGMRYLKSGSKPVYDTNQLVNRFNMIIIDESSLFKSYSSNRFKLLKNWCSKVEDVYILSATPTPKSIEDLWSQIYLLDNGQRLGKNITTFRNTYASPIPMYNGCTRYEYSQQATDYILSLVKDITTSVPDAPVPLFPEPILKKILIKPDLDTEKLINSLRSDFIVHIDGQKIRADNQNQLMIKIAQIASGDVYNKESTLHINDVKFTALKHMLSSINTPVLIAYTYKFDKEKLLTLPGAELITTERIEDWNNNKIKIGIISPFSIAHGLNLQYSDCQDIIWFSPIWDTEKWQQTNARICRRGQTRKVTIRVLILKNTFDDYAFDLVQTKFNAQYNNLRRLS